MSIDTKQFAKLYDEFAPKIFKFCYFRVSSKEEAEDIVTQAFIRAWDHIAAGKRVTNVQAFLYRIAGNLIIDFYRRRKDQREVPLDDPERPVDLAVAPDLPERMDRDTLINTIQAKINQLPESYREVLILRYINDVPIKDIAVIMEMSENTVSVRLHRAIEKLKALL